MADHAPDRGGETGQGSGQELSAAAVEAGRILFAQPCRFFYACQTLELLPEAELPELAVAGRSNVGKSSLLNALTGQKALARASNTPGRTRQLNFFDLGERLVLVDMPGYGYAQAPKEVKADWQGLMFDYLRGRPTLRRVLLLVDSRVGTKATDHMAMDLLDQAAITYQIVLTKIDGLKPRPLEARIAEMRDLARKHAAAHPHIHATSSETGAGIAELRAEIAAFAT